MNQTSPKVVSRLVVKTTRFKNNFSGKIIKGPVVAIDLKLPQNFVQDPELTKARTLLGSENQ